MKFNTNNKLPFFYEKKIITKLILLGLFSSFFYFIILKFTNIFTDLNFLEPLADNPFYQIDKYPLYGIISNIVIFLWFASFLINVFLITKYKKDISLKASNKLLKSLYIGGYFSLLLFFLDLNDFQNKFREEYIYIFLISNAIFLMWYISKTFFYKNIFIIFLLSFIFLAFSMIIDLYQGRNIFKIARIYTTTIEELFKTLGASYFLFFWIETLRKFYKQNKILH